VRLPCADDHSLHPIDEALDDGGAIILALGRGEVDRKLTAQLERIAGLASRGPCRFEDLDGPLAGQSRIRCGRARPTRYRGQAGDDLSSCIARHLRAPAEGAPNPASAPCRIDLRQNDDAAAVADITPRASTRVTQTP
jgi:hypothetical protein